ncbi:glycosyl hydrolase [Xylariaceae sp. FL0016]|nr:glycosyl hydrolase [Xylariaceae sp. FL0016]
MSQCTPDPIPRPGTVFRNPVLRGFNPDPTICTVPASHSSTRETTYFLSTSTFEFFPSCAIYVSHDLINWRLIGHALTRRSQIEMRTVEPGAGSWAATLRYRERERRWYLATGVFQRYKPQEDERIFPRGFYVYTDNIWDDSAWSDPVYFDNPGFDQDLFWDDAHDKVYLSTTVRLANRPPLSTKKDFGIHVSEVDLPSGRTLTPPLCIRESPHGIAEGSHILKRDDWWYLFTAEGGTEAGHQEWCFRTKEGVYGPWEGQGAPLWYNGPDEEVQRTGHADVFQDGEGKWWAVLLGVRPVRGASNWLEPQLGRETFLVKVDWVDDWPVFNDGRNITLETRGRKSATQLAAGIKPGDVKWTAALDQKNLELGWYQKNTPLKPCYTLTDRPGHLRLYGNCYSLSSPEAPAMLLRKQTAYSETFEVKLDFNPRKTGYEAGVVLWWNQYSYATIGMTLADGDNPGQTKIAILRRPAGAAIETSRVKLCQERQELQPASDESARLQIAAQPNTYRMSLKYGSNESICEVNIQDMTTMPPVGAAFCGMMFGIYAFGNMEPVLDPADFFDITIKEH